MLNTGHCLRSVTSSVSVVAGAKLAYARHSSPGWGVPLAHQDTQDGRLNLFETGSILGDPGTDSGGEGKSKRAEKNDTKITFLPAIFSHPFRLFLDPTICHWVSEDGPGMTVVYLPSKYLIRQQFQDQGLPSPLLV